MVHGRVHYLELEKPNRIVYAQQFCDEKEQVITAPFFADWLRAMMTTVELCATGLRTMYTRAAGVAAAYASPSFQGRT